MGLQQATADIRSESQMDLSHRRLEDLRMEIEKLNLEREQRERKLDARLGRLRMVCMELGEDATSAASEAHPSMQSYR